MTPEVSRALENGEPAILPTETVYGLAARADMPAAIDRLYALKGREDSKPLALCVTNAEMAKAYANITPEISRVMAAFWPGPLTLICEAKMPSDLDRRVIASMGTVGLRCPKSDWAGDMPWPLALTSANISGGPDPVTFVEAKSAFPKDIAGIDAGPCDIGLASTVVSIKGKETKILRQGAITLSDLEPYL